MVLEDKEVKKLEELEAILVNKLKYSQEVDKKRNKDNQSMNIINIEPRKNVSFTVD